MALYLGCDKVKINLDGIVRHLNLYTVVSTIVDNVLLSSDNYILKDTNGLYLIPKIIVPYNVAMSSDGYILQDSNQQYITIKEDN